MVRMHDRKMVRIIGEPFDTVVVEPRPQETIGKLVFGKTKQKTVTMQTVEYVTARTVVQVPLSEIYDPSEPRDEQLELAAD